MSGPKEETIRRLRLGDLQKVLRWRYGPTLPDDDAGREDLRLLLQTISMGQGDWTKLKNAIEVWAPWMDAGEALQFIDDVNRTPDYLRKPKARLLGEKLGLLNHERIALGLRTIAPIDMTDDQLQEQRRKRKQASEQRRRRAKGVKPREVYLSNSLAKLKPWKAAGVSRATWYRRETGLRPIKLTNTGHALVSLEGGRVRKRTVEVVSEQQGRKQAR
jgi:hypothetical protein